MNFNEINQGNKVCKFCCFRAENPQIWTYEHEIWQNVEDLRTPKWTGLLVPYAVPNFMLICQTS